MSDSLLNPDQVLPPEVAERLKAKSDLSVSRHLLGESGRIHAAIHEIHLVRNRGPKDKTKTEVWMKLLNAAIQILETAKEERIAESIQLMGHYGVKLPKEPTNATSQEALDTDSKGT